MLNMSNLYSPIICFIADILKKLNASKVMVEFWFLTSWYYESFAQTITEDTKLIFLPKGYHLQIPTGESLDWNSLSSFCSSYRHHIFLSQCLIVNQQWFNLQMSLVQWSESWTLAQERWSQSWKCVLASQAVSLELRKQFGFLTWSRNMIDPSISPTFYQFHIS